MENNEIQIGDAVHYALDLFRPYQVLATRQFPYTKDSGGIISVSEGKDFIIGPLNSEGSFTHVTKGLLAKIK